jgi:GNAT superfamily N-acetyltransferase
MRSIGFRQPRPLIVYAGLTDSAVEREVRPENLLIDTIDRRGRIEAWFDGALWGVCNADVLGDRLAGDLIAHYVDPTAVRLPPNETNRRGGNRRAQRRVAGNTWAHVRRLWVDRNARGVGVGTALMHAMVTNLASRGIHQWALHLPDGADIGPAHGLYSRFGRVIDRQYVMRLSF